MEQKNKDYKEFLKETKNIYSSHNFKIKNCYGVKDYYSFYKKNKKKETYKITQAEFCKVIRAINTALGEELANGEDIVFPERMGTLEARKYIVKPSFDKDGKLKYSAHIDWQATLKLWYEDEESKLNKTLVHVDKRESCKFKYNKKTSIYKNQIYYEFFINRGLYKKVVNRLHNKEIDLFLI